MMHTEYTTAQIHYCNNDILQIHASLNNHLTFGLFLYIMRLQFPKIAITITPVRSMRVVHHPTSFRP